MPSPRSSIASMDIPPLFIHAASVRILFARVSSWARVFLISTRSRLAWKQRSRRKSKRYLLQDLGTIRESLQASLPIFHELLTETLKGVNLELCSTTPYVIRVIVGNELIAFLAMHVDGIKFARSESVSHAIVNAFHDIVPTKHLGDWSWYMGRHRENIPCSVKGHLDRFNVSQTSANPASRFPDTGQ